MPNKDNRVDDLTSIGRSRARTDPADAVDLIATLSGQAAALEIAAEHGKVSDAVYPRLTGAASVLRIAIEHLRYEIGLRDERP